jgi:membrane-associated phospholipid phosphatase
LAVGPTLLEVIFGVALGTVLVASPAAAQSAGPRALRWDPALDATVLTLGVTALVLSEELKPALAPSSCRWCAVDSLDEHIRAALLWRDRAAADATSGIVAFVVTPLALGGLDALAAARDGVGRYAGEDILLIAEAGVLAADLTELTKVLAARERPFVHALSPDSKRLTAQAADNNLSFFSGHTSVAFALATAAGTVTTMHRYSWAPAVWGVGLVAASTTGYLRIAADKHWLTDVLVGAAVGSAVGLLVPVAFHAPVDDPGKTPPTAPLRAPLPLLAIAW